MGKTRILVKTFLLLLVCTCIVGGVQAVELYEFAAQWGSFGSDDGQFVRPEGICVDSKGNVYVTDTYYVADSGSIQEINNRIQKFDSARHLHHKMGIKWNRGGPVLVSQGNSGGWRRHAIRRRTEQSPRSEV